LPLTVFSPAGCHAAHIQGIREIDRSVAIVAEAAQNSNRAIYPLTSEVEKFDGLIVGSWASEEKILALIQLVILPENHQGGAVVNLTLVIAASPAACDHVERGYLFDA
jgi:hypothetical protein